jgi:hypothetical protein
MYTIHYSYRPVTASLRAAPTCSSRTTTSSTVTTASPSAVAQRTSPGGQFSLLAFLDCILIHGHVGTLIARAATGCPSAPLALVDRSPTSKMSCAFVLRSIRQNGFSCMHGQYREYRYGARIPVRTIPILTLCRKTHSTAHVSRVGRGGMGSHASAFVFADHGIAVH